MLLRRALAASFLTLLASAARADLNSPLNFTSRADEPLAAALTRLSQSANISLIFSSAQLQGLMAPALDVRGAPAARVLERLLQQAPLSWRAVNREAVAVVATEPPVKPVIAAPRLEEEIVVTGHKRTGSRMTHAGIDHSQPLKIIGAAEIAASNSFTLGDFLQQLPQQAGNSTNSAIGNGGDGSATMTLRGLPSIYTLVLLDGQRLASSGLTGQSVDLNTLPLAAVERIEVLPSGASAIYGSDAIAGTINIITRKRFAGVRLRQRQGQSSRGDLDSRSSDLLLGAESDRAGFSLSLSDSRDDGLYSRERGVSADMRARGGIDARSAATPNSQLFMPAWQPPWYQFVTPLDGTDGSSLEQFRPVDLSEDKFDYSAYTSAVAPSRQQALNLYADYEFSDSARALVRAGASRSETEITHAPTPIVSSSEPSWQIAWDNRYNPFGLPSWYVQRRMVELGPRIQTDKTRSQWLQLGLEGVAASAEDSAWLAPATDIHWQARLFYANSEGAEQIDNLVDAERLIRAVGPDSDCSGDCVPLNLFGAAGSIDRAQADYLRAASDIEGYNRNYGVELQLDGDLWQSANGAFGLATGLSWRREIDSLESHDQPLIGSVATPQLYGDRHITEWFVETDIPLIKRLPGAHSLDLQLALRHSWYSDFGHNTSPSAGISYRTSPSWLWRASWGRGYRAPSIDSLNREGFATYSSFVDPCSHPDNVGVLPGCAVQSDPRITEHLTVLHANLHLDPEESEHRNVGFSWTPLALDGFHFDANYYHTEIEQMINSLGILIGDTSGRPLATVRRDRFGNIAQIDTVYVNSGERLVEAVDLALGYQFDSDWGRWQLELNGSRLLNYRDRPYHDSADENLVGTYVSPSEGGNGALPKWKASSRLGWSGDWERHQFELNYHLHYTGSMTETVPQVYRERTIDSWLVQDVQLSYRPAGLEGLELLIGVDNLTDEDAPFIASSTNDGMDATTHNLKGRYYTAQLSYSFE